MISNIHWINDAQVGEKRIGIMARPRANDWLDDEIKSLKTRRIDCLVSLLEKSEEWELGLQDEKEVCKKWGIEFVNFPIKDVNVPLNDFDFIRLAKELAIKVKKKQKIVIHCRMGIGRASILAAAIMIILGCKGQDVFEKIGKYRKLKVPDTEKQKDWILSIEDKLC